MIPTMSVSSFSTFVTLELIAIVTIINISFYNGSSSMGCIEAERQALLGFKQHLIDPSNRLASWINTDGDCCAWTGVICSNLTSHVHELHLGNPVNDYDDYEAYERSKLTGEINSSLLDLKHLVYLNLSHNDFGGVLIPAYFGSMMSLRYLDLSYSDFSGMVPHQLGNLSNLQHLDLSRNRGNLYVENFQWLSTLLMLQHLDLSSVNLSKASDWVSVANTLHALVVLQLSGCELRHLPSLSSVNFSSLAKIDLSSNNFNSSSIPSWVFSLTHLDYLDFSFNNFQGPIPNLLQNLTSLSHLDLSGNNFNSSIPDFLYHFSRLEYLSLFYNSLKGTISDKFGNLTSIESLDLSRNKIQGKISRSFRKLCHLRSICVSSVNLSQDISEILDIFASCVSNRLEYIDLGGSGLYGRLTKQIGQFKSLSSIDVGNNSISGLIPSSLGGLSSLRALYLNNNNFSGTLSQVHFANLPQLVALGLSENPLLRLKFNSTWVPPFQLRYLYLSSCQVGPRFPAWLRSLKQLHYLDVSNSSISDTIPSWFWQSFSDLYWLNMSQNHIYGKIPDLTESSQLATLDFGSNNLSGPLPLIIPSSLGRLDLSNNAFSRSIDHVLCNVMNGSKLQVLNLRGNRLSGEIPDCWMPWQQLKVMDLGNNNFTGVLPKSIGTLSLLRVIHIQKNHLYGIVPASLVHCTELVTLDLSENEFVGAIPTWIGGKLSKLKVLNLRSNKFQGPLPMEICHLDSLQVLDLACNNLSGRIPRCIMNFNAMVTVNYSDGNKISYSCFGNASISHEQVERSLGDFVDDQFLVMKGKMYHYTTTLNLVREIDLSKNNFSGEIPAEVTHLTGLGSLNLSYNSLTGKIPKSIGDMRSIEHIDFSCNQLSGEIPHSISLLTSLSHLILSNNNLTGKIPSGAQLQTFDPSWFAGNELCGAPLPQDCSTTSLTPENENKEGKDEPGKKDEMLWFYVSMMFGFVIGFWGFVGPLFVNRRWRYMYYNFLDHLGYKFRDALRKCF